MATQIKLEDIPQEFRGFYTQACKLYQQNVHYTEFSNTFFRQDSELMKCFKTKKERETFLKSPLYHALQEMKEGLFIQQELDDTISIRFPKKVYDSLKIYAKQEGMQTSAIINELLEEGLLRRGAL